MKYLLHIDTATDTGRVALGGDGALIAWVANTEARNHASAINNMIAEVMQQAGLPLSAIDGVVVCAGPGSYTGLRIGLATAKGLCYMMDKPLLLDNRLTLLAYQNFIKQWPQTHTAYMSLIIAREKEYFAAIYDSNFNIIFAPKHIMDEELKSIVSNYDGLCIVTNAEEVKIEYLNINDFKINNDIEINLPVWTAYAFEQYKCNNTVNLSTAEPFYLKQVYTHK